MNGSGAVGRRILLVDDDPFIISLYVSKLKRAGLEVEAVPNGEEALRRLEAVRPDLVILDLNMPKLNGIEVLKQIRNTPALESLPVLVLTNVCSDSVMRETWEARPTRYLIKRETPPNVVIDEVLALLKSAAPAPGIAAAPAASTAARPSAETATETPWRPEIMARAGEVLDARSTEGFRSALTDFRSLVEPFLQRCRQQSAGSFAVLFADTLDALMTELLGHPENVTPSLLRAFEMGVERLQAMFDPAPFIPGRPLEPAIALVVASDDFLRDSIGRLLERVVLRPIRAGREDIGLHLMRENTFKLAVVDAAAPEEYLENIHALPTASQCPVILITAPEDYRPAQKPGLERLAKPISPTDLLIKALLLTERL